MDDKYRIHSDFKLLRFLHMPFNRVMLAVENGFLSLLYHLQPIPRNVTRKRLKIQSRGTGKIKIDLFRPKSLEGELPAIVYFPGGGYVIPATHIHQYNLTKIVAEKSIIGVIVHYRLAKRHPFPDALYDALDVLGAIHEETDRFRIDPRRIILGGDSAGGNLAAAVALHEKDNQGLSYPQMLVYPALNRGGSSVSRKEYDDAPMLKVSTLDKIAALFYRNGYLGLEKYAFPCQHPDPSGIGQTYIETAEFDPLRDDGTCYYEKLKQAGVNVHLEETKGTVHGYDIVKRSPIVQASVRKRHEFIEAILQQFSQQ